MLSHLLWAHPHRYRCFSSIISSPYIVSPAAVFLLRFPVCLAGGQWQDLQQKTTTIYSTPPLNLTPWLLYGRTIYQQQSTTSRAVPLQVPCAPPLLSPCTFTPSCMVLFYIFFFNKAANLYSLFLKKWILSHIELVIGVHVI